MSTESRQRHVPPAETPAFPGWRYVLAAAAAGAVVAWLVVGAATGPRLDYAVGDRVRTEVVAPEPISVVDTDQTEALREAAASRVPPVFDYDPAAQARVVDDVRAALTRLGDANEATRPPRSAPGPAAPVSAFPYGGEDVVAVFARRGADPALSARVLDVLGRRLSGNIVGDDVPAAPEVTVRNAATGETYPMLFRDLVRLARARSALSDDLRALGGLSSADRTTLASAFEPLVAATLRPNPAATEAARAGARAAVGEVRDEFARGDVVAFRNQVVDERLSRALAAVARLRAVPNRLARWAGVTLLAWTLIGAFWSVAGTGARIALDRPSAFLLAALALVAEAAIVRLGAEAAIRIGALGADDPQYLLAVPYAVAPLVVGLLAGRALGLVVGLSTVPLVTIQTAATPGGGLPAAAFAAVVSVVAAAAASRYSARQVVALAAVWLAAGSVPALAVMKLLASGPAPSSARVVATDVGLACLGAVLTAALAAVALPAAEWAFDVLSDVRLLELASADRPLLRELAIRAPGTHQHSYVMSSVATEAAKAIGANAMLARVGAYYHDIGKLHAPEMFVENQRGGPNPHDQMPPEESARVILRHVSYGIELAREAKLPGQVRELITGHHGTRVVHVFLEKARRAAPAGSTVDESRFRYPGPKPQTRESAILMLADGAEAAVRSLDEPTYADVDAIVRKIAEAVLADDQLDECGLTLGEVHRVREAIVRTLVDLHHRRVKYPGFNPPDR